MESPVAASGPVLRRAATFNHRMERVLKDVNGRVGLVNKSQEHLSKSKTSVDVQKVTRPGKQYSAVASRYAAPLVSKKQPSSVRDGPNGGNANVTKLPFITGRSVPQHQRRPSSDNLSSFQPPMVFTASARDPKPDTLAKKADRAINAVGSKRPRVAKRTSMIVKKSPAQTRPPRFYSLGKGQCSGSKNGSVRVSVDAPVTGTPSLLYSAAHWVSLIKLAEGEKKHDVVIDLFRLATRLKAEPTEDVVGELKRYQESYPGDEAVIQLVEQCEDTQQEVCSLNGEVIDKSVCEAEEVKSAASEAGGDVLDGASESKSVIIPAVVSENEAAMKDVAQKPPHFRGRMLSRSSTFSCVDPKSQSQHAKADYGKKLAETVEFLAMQAGTRSPSKTGDMAEIRSSKIQNLPLACVPEVEIICKSTTTTEVQATPSFGVVSKILDFASEVGSKLAAQPASENFGSPVFEVGCSTLMSGQDNGSAEKPVDSLSKWLDGDQSPEMGSPGVQSSLREDAVDFCPYRTTGVGSQCSLSKTQNAPLASVPVVETFSKSSTALEVVEQSDVEPSEKLSNPMPALRTPSLISDDQATPSFKVASNNVELASKVGSEYAADLTLHNYSSPVSEVGSTRESAVCNGSAEQPVDSLSEWLDGDSSEMGTPEIQSALSEETVDLSPDRRRAVKLMDVDSLMREVVSHFLPDHIANSSADSKTAELNGRSSAHEFQRGGNNWQDAAEQSVTENVENISRSHRLSLDAEADLQSRGSVEGKVKLFTELAEVRSVTPGLAEPSDPGSASKERHGAEVPRDIKVVASGTTSAAEISAETSSAADTPAVTEFAVDPALVKVADVKVSVEAESATEIPTKTDPRVTQNEDSNVSLATPLRMLTKQKSMKSDMVTPFIPFTPSAAIPSEPASVGILRARHRRASSVGNMTPRGPFDMTGECSPFGDSSSSPSGQSSSTKSKRVSRGAKEVTPRFNLPKPSWKAVVEREMKGSKLKDLLAAKLPEETSPLAEYVQSQMENQNRDPGSGSTGAKEKDATSTCSPSKRVAKMTKSSSKKRSAVKESQDEGATEPSTDQKLTTLIEGEQEFGAGITCCPTPGSAVRRSARIQSKVQSRRNILFKDEFAYLQ